MRFPNFQLFAQQRDIVSQILNFGLPAPMRHPSKADRSASFDQNYQVAQQIAKDLTGVPGAADVHVQPDHQRPPTHDRHRSDRGATERLNLRAETSPTACPVSLNGAAPATTNFWLNYKNGVAYQVVVQTPQNPCHFEPVNPRQSRWVVRETGLRCRLTGPVPETAGLEVTPA